MTKVIKVIGFANDAFCPVKGQFLETFDFEAAGGLGYGEFTPDVSKAKKFSSTYEALEFWRTQSKTKPLRSDGEPNRPLTCTTVEVTDPEAPGGGGT